MNFPSELQQEVEQWAKSVGLSAEQFVVQVVSEKLNMLRQQQKSHSVELLKINVSSHSKDLRMYRKHGILVIETGQLSGFDINAFISEMREERIQEQMGQIER
jgi:hypothetical protein